MWTICISYPHIIYTIICNFNISPYYYYYYYNQLSCGNLEYFTELRGRTFCHGAMWCMYTKVLSTAHSPLRPSAALRVWRRWRNRERIFCTWRNTGAAVRWTLQLKALEPPGESYRWWIDGWQPLSIIWALSGKGAFTKPAGTQYNLHADQPHFCFITSTGLESTQRYCSTERSWGKLYLVFCPQVLHTKITKPLKNTSLFLMNTKAVKEVVQNERTDTVAQKNLLKCTAPWVR